MQVAYERFMPFARINVTTSVFPSKDTQFLSKGLLSCLCFQVSTGFLEKYFFNDLSQIF